MKISLPSSPTRFGFPFRIIGCAGRYDTISDCEFIDDSHMVCVDRQEAKLYLIEFEYNGSHTILDSQTIVHNNLPQHFELLSIRRTIPAIPTTSTTVYSISYRNTLFSCNIRNNKFCNFNATLINVSDNYHGVCAHGDASVFVTNMLAPTITEYNTKTHAKRQIVCAGGTRMKDMAIIDDDYILAISSDRGPINGVQNADGTVSPHNPPYNSHALIYNRHTGERIATHTFENTQIDACIYHVPYCYVTCTNIQGNGYIFRSKLVPLSSSGSGLAYNFTENVHVQCAGFPHGIAIHGDMIAYTSYSDSAVFIHKYSDFFNQKNP
jgi:hypothetical protein